MSEVPLVQGIMRFGSPSICLSLLIVDIFSSFDEIRFSWFVLDSEKSGLKINLTIWAKPVF